MKFTWRLILQLHIYLGLFSIPMLLVFAISSFNFNHDILPNEPIAEPETTDLELSPQHWNNMELQVYGKALRDSIGLYGWFLPWASRSDSSSAVIQLGAAIKEHRLFVSPNGHVQKTTTTKGISELFKLLHFLGEDIPNAPWWLSGWKYYQHMSVYSTLFWVVSGVYLWWRKRDRSKAESHVLWIGAAITSMLIIAVWFIR